MTMMCSLLRSYYRMALSAIYSRMSAASLQRRINTVIKAERGFKMLTEGRNEAVELCVRSNQ